MQNQANSEYQARYKVLLVEDQPVIRLIHINFLQSLDCFVYFAENGNEALHHLKENLHNKLSKYKHFFIFAGGSYER